MTILLQHTEKQYVNKDCTAGFCEEKKFATEFKSIFTAMQYLISQNEISIEQYDFINNNQRKARHHVNTETNINRRRRRIV